MFANKYILLIGGGFESTPGILKAKEMGLGVIVVDGNKDAPGFEIADDRIVVSTYDISGTVKAAWNYHTRVRPISGVSSVATDVPLTVATVAEKLGLPGMTVDTAFLSSDKLAMKQCFHQNNIPAPFYKEISNPKQLGEIFGLRGYPLIIKPVDSRGARGVLRITDDVDIEWAFQHSLSHSPSGRVMVEEFLEGPQISTEALLIDGKGYTAGFSDRNYEFLDKFSPYIIENGGEQPSRLSENDKRAISELAIEAGKALGVTSGVVKGDMVLTPQGPKVIEIATRLSGGWFCTDQIPLATGIDLVGSAIRLAIGEDIDPEELTQTRHQGVAIRYFFPEPGRVSAIENLESTDNIPWIHKIAIYLSPGDTVEPVSDHTKRAGFVITTGSDRKEAIQRAESVINNVRIITAPN